MSEPQYTIKDMVGFAVQSNPNQLATAFDQVIGPKIAKALDDKKVEVAQRYFNPSQQEPEAEEQEVEAAADDAEEDKEEDNNTEASDGNEDTESATQEV